MRALIAAVALGLVLTACSAEKSETVVLSQPSPNPWGLLPVPGTEDWPFASYQRPTGSTGGRLAELTGTLELRDGCLVVAREDYPLGVALLLDSEFFAWVDGGLESPDGQHRREVGDRVDFAGSYGEIEDFQNSYVVQELGMPATCPSLVFSTR